MIKYKVKGIEDLQKIDKTCFTLGQELFRKGTKKQKKDPAI